MRRYEEGVAKMEAKRQLRDEALREAREGFHQRQSEMMASVYKSQVGLMHNHAVMTDDQLEAVLAGPAPGKKGGALPHL